MDVRAAAEAEIDHLAKLWYDGRQDAHARILPSELARHRTLESFKHRLQVALWSVRVAGQPGEPVGFCMIKDDELYQLYISAGKRGSGLAAELRDSRRTIKPMPADPRTERSVCPANSATDN